MLDMFGMKKLFVERGQISNHGRIFSVNRFMVGDLGEGPINVDVYRVIGSHYKLGDHF